jgi:hypothetical protein
MANPEPDIVAAWMVEHPAIARGRLFTASVHMTMGLHYLDRLVGYFDSNNPGAPYVELGMKEVRSQLMKVVRALDMVAPIDETVTPPERPAVKPRSGHLNEHGAYICGPCSGGNHLGVGHAGSEHALCQCPCDGAHNPDGSLKR